MFVLGAHHADVGVLHARGIQLRFRLYHVGLRRGAPVQQVRGEFHHIGVLIHGRVQQLLLRIGAAQLEIVHR